MDDILWRLRDWVPGHGVEFELSGTGIQRSSILIT